MSPISRQARMVTLLATLFCLPLQAKVLHSSAHGFTLENSIEVPADPAATWAALVHDVDQWWPKDHSWFGKAGEFRIEPRAGGCFCEVAGERQSMHMQITFADPGRLLRMTGGLGPLQGMGLSGALDWKLEKAGTGTRITLRYVVGGYATEDLLQFAPIVDQVQGIQLGGLGAHLSKHRRQVSAVNDRRAPKSDG
jgi:uncharacterized protein YndB with AHSA1/START domain